ncbi:MAG: flippase-like domain-containing protein [Chloroflexi bacterium]|uniref:Flippase-like domain-containing protein n=1 Tax=Candidatus Chlorohelix allophototropha TaxID=3003348 RepID=A0A8T7M257_9CHLR|nr:flippase-like domain-containing protein [Chloroflexota bacterium]WJW67842.1 flippase-like domain-containing protein [Chloroflexota bacterium L227-S17]
MKYLKFVIGLLISGVCLWLAIKDIQFAKVGDALGTLNWWWLLSISIPTAIVIYLKVWRNQILLKPDHVHKYRLFTALMISYLWNTILPARLGEVVRAYTVARTEKIGTVRVFSAILLEKILDIIPCFVLLLGLIPFLSIEDGFKTSVLLLGSVMVGAFLVCLLMAWQRNRAEKFIKFVLKLLPAKIGNKLYGFAEEVLDAVSILLDPRLAFILFIQSMVQWTLNSLVYLWVAWAVGLPMSFEVGMMVMIASNLGMVVPAAPGYIGTFEVVILAVLPASLNVAYANRDLVFTYALLEHIVGFLPVVLLGAFYTWHEGLKLGKVDKTLEQESLTTPAAEIKMR